jgi:hypothetical protein
MLVVAAHFSSEEMIFCATPVLRVSNILSVAVGVSYTYRNCNGGRTYILQSNTVRHAELQVTVGRAVPTDLEGIPRLAGSHISGKDLDLNSEGFHWALVRTFEVSWLSSASRDESWKSRTACQSTAIPCY